MLEEIGFTDVTITARYDTFGGAGGERKARLFDVHGYTFAGRKPG